MEVMELRESLEDASSEDEAAEVRQRNKSEPSILCKENDRNKKHADIELTVNLDQTVEKLEEAFSVDPVDVEKAQKAAIGLRYWTNIDRAAREWQPGKPVELIH